MSEKVLASITYWHQFMRFGEELGISLDHDEIEHRLARYKGQDFIPFDTFKDMVESILIASGRPWLGLDFAQKMQLSSHGSLGFAISHGVDLNECLELISRYYQTRLQAIDIKGQLREQHYVLSIYEHCDWQPISQLLNDVLVTSLINVIEFIIGKEVAQCEVYFPYPEPAWADRHQALLPCPVSFGASVATVKIPAQLLTITNTTGNRRSVDFARIQCDQEMALLHQFDTYTEKVISLIEPKHYHLTIEEVAKKLNTSKSTLARKLKLEKTSYSDILTDLKKQRAYFLLTQTNQSIESIALELGYDELSNFGRSCKRWFQRSPAQLRKLHQ